uniref:Large subunit GTPase 1 homolog n=1 Tax=Biomphalaria glabrata TaxID=6526 RepID=A0A2C9K526_BIOGL
MPVADTVGNQKRRRHTSCKSVRSSASWGKTLEDYEHIQLTPYEKNLDFWRQLWRVIERSDVIVQIVDARNPLLFRCEDLDRYVKEVDSKKTVLLLINKADFLNETQRNQWVDYFNKEGITAVFFSAKVEKEIQKELPQKSSASSKSDSEDSDEDNDDVLEEESDEEDDSEEYDDDHHHDTESLDKDSNVQSVNVSAAQNDRLGSNELVDNRLNDLSLQENVNSGHSGELTRSSVNSCQQKSKQTVTNNCDEVTSSASTTASPLVNKADIVTAQELLDIFRKLAQPASQGKEVSTIGMVGYPNVGKSSTINVILDKKQLGVSATPGKTKHLQGTGRFYFDLGYCILNEEIRKVNLTPMRTSYAM